MIKAKIIIAGDMLPMPCNYDLFSAGDTKALSGDRREGAISRRLLSLRSGIQMFLRNEVFNEIGNQILSNLLRVSDTKENPNDN